MDETGPTPAPSPAPDPPVFVRSAVRCGECHGRMEQEWAGSAHARAARSPAYRAMRDMMGADGDDCARCHQPLARHVRDKDALVAAAAAEGVTCDVCHTMTQAEPSRAGGSFTMRVHGRARYGPLCDALDHYFHSMACSELHQQAVLCGACHWLELSAPGRNLPVYTTYADWKASSYAARGVVCQMCHMAGGPGEVAVGAGERQVVSAHAFLDDELRRKAAVLRARISPQKPDAGPGRGGKQGEGTQGSAGMQDGAGEQHGAGEQDGGAAMLRVDYEIENSGAGHAIPSGLPARRLVLRVRTVDRGGAIMDRAATSFGRVLVDDAGRVVPFVRAVRVAEDTRIPAEKARSGHLLVAAPRAGAIEIELVWQALAPEVARALGQVEVAEHRLLHTRHVLAAPGARKVDSVIVRP